MFHEAPAQFGASDIVHFTQASVGPAQALNRIVEAVRNGDRIVLFTAQDDVDRRAVLCEVGPLSGRIIHDVQMADARALDAQLTAFLADHGFASAPATQAANAVKRGIPMEQDHHARHLLIIDNAESLPASMLGLIARCRHHRDNGEVQLVLAGKPGLLAKLCDPECMALWSNVRLAVTLEGQGAAASVVPDRLVRLRDQIARTEARLVAQRRLLAIFSDRSNPDEQSDGDDG